MLRSHCFQREYATNASGDPVTAFGESWVPQVGHQSAVETVPQGPQTTPGGGAGEGWVAGGL